jgi:hypothetical protein
MSQTTVGMALKLPDHKAAFKKLVRCETSTLDCAGHRAELPGPDDKLVIGKTEIDEECEYSERGKKIMKLQI